jgi:hypothetical protein
VVIERLKIVVAGRPDTGWIAIWVKTRERREGDDETRFNVATEALLKKFERVCQNNGLAPWLAFYVHASGDLYLTSTANYRAKYRALTKIPAWKMDTEAKRCYARDKDVMHINAAGSTVFANNWFGRLWKT